MGGVNTKSRQHLGSGYTVLEKYMYMYKSYMYKSYMYIVYMHIDVPNMNVYISTFPTYWFIFEPDIYKSPSRFAWAVVIYVDIHLHQFRRMPGQTSPPFGRFQLSPWTTVDGSEIPNNHLACKKTKNLVNNGIIDHINWLAGFLNHQLYQPSFKNSHYY